MKSLLGRIAVVAPLFALLSAAPLRADFNVPTSYCGGSSFQTCASVQLTWVNATTATLVISNVGPYGLFTAVGLTNLPPGATLASTSTPQGWDAVSPPNNLSGGMLPGETVQASAEKSKAAGLAVGGAAAQFIFTFTVPVQGWENVGVGVHATRGPLDACSSSKLNITPGGGTNTVAYSAGCGGMSTVPEPATLGLVASGLAALGGGSFLRRRRKV